MFFVMVQIIFAHKVHIIEGVMQNLTSFLSNWNDKKVISALFEDKFLLVHVR
jgi:hypothetical protein